MNNAARTTLAVLTLLSVLTSLGVRAQDQQPMTPDEFATFTQGVGAGLAIIIAKLYPDAYTVSNCIASQTPETMYAGLAATKDDPKYSPETSAAQVLVDWLMDHCLEEGQLKERLRLGAPASQ